ncbi:MAG TPA: phenylalanine--tRNA ligase subunit beta [Candidatus Angelobacter sp.]|nr:phenylalanine--tRNA ligase subunit beta [Candidatus Angelobacter sp.]
MKFSYNWLRELVPGLNMEVTELARQITMKTAECEGVHDPGAFPGASVSDVAKAEGNEVDAIIEIDNKSLTNRPDLWGHLGMAREVAAIAGLSVADPVGELYPFTPKAGVNGGPLKAPAAKGDLSITIADPSLCARFSGQRVENVKVAPSPLWMQVRLNSLGVNPINNLVDVTNYVLCELGQPMHAYDADLLGDTIIVRAAKKGEGILALNGEKYSLSAEDIVIADANKPVGIAGIIGGNDTAIRDTTTRIVLEAANFSAAPVRKSSARLKLRTDASMRFEKGQDPENTARALARAVELLKQISPGSQAAQPIDIYARKLPIPKITLDIDWAERKLGRKLSTEEVINIFRALVFGVEQAGPRKLVLTVPSWRATKDISIPEDLVEEIGRMVGYASITPQAPAVLAEPVPRNLDHEQHRAVREALKGQGFTEVSNYSFISEADATLFGYDTGKLLQVANPIVAEQKYMRPNLLPGIRRNLTDNSRYFADFRLFEIGREYHKDKTGKPQERTHLIAAIFVRDGGRDLSGAHVLEMKRVAQYLVPEFTLAPDKDHTRTMHPERSAHIEAGGERVGSLYELHPSLLENARGRAAILDLDLDALRALPAQPRKYEPLRRFPTSSFDLSIVAGERELVADLESKLRRLAGDDLVALQFLLIFALPGGKKSVSFRLTAGAEHRTLTADEVTRIRERVVQGIKSAGYELRE